MSTKRIKRDVHGVLLLDKPSGMSSNRALQRVKHHFQARKAGHTGSLDPLATGMLPICFGDATRYSHVLLDAAKTYDVVAVLGATSATGDGEGEITARSPVPDQTLAQWQSVADQFVGAGTQIPPMYSALKFEGKRLYEIARKGEQVPRPPRHIIIDYIRVTLIQEDRLAFSVRCSKGTYIRSLVEDIAAAAGTLAWTTGLRRTGVDPFSAPMIPLDDVLALDSADPHLMGCDAGLAGRPAIELSAADSLDFCQGKLALMAAETAGFHRCYGPDGLFLGSANVRADGSFDGVRVMSAARATLEAIGAGEAAE